MLRVWVALSVLGFSPILQSLLPMSPEIRRIETERFAVSPARRFDTERFAKFPSRSHYESVSGDAADLGAGIACALAGKTAEPGCARTAGEDSVERCCASAVAIRSRALLCISWADLCVPCLQV